MRINRWFVVVVLLGVFAAACIPADDPVLPTSRPTATHAKKASKLRRNQVHPDCLAGCFDTDSFPLEIGEFINYTITPENCTGDIDDADGDGLADLCEELIADQFMPVLQVDPNDADYNYISGGLNVLNGEPAYAIKPVWYGDTLVVRVMYMFSYYIDAQTGWCNSLIDVDSISHTALCGHYGDSEAVLLDVRYEPAIYHWVVDKAYLSRHTHYDAFWGSSSTTVNETGFLSGLMSTVGRVTGGYPTALEYYGRTGGVPIIHVAYNKHANYVSESACNSHNIIDELSATADVCENTVYYQLGPISPYRNVGATSTHLMDCVHSYFGGFSSDSECYWSGALFGGWAGSNTPKATAYYRRLSNWSF